VARPLLVLGPGAAVVVCYPEGLVVDNILHMPMRAHTEEYTICGYMAAVCGIWYVGGTVREVRTHPIKARPAAMRYAIAVGRNSTNVNGAGRSTLSCMDVHM
jgi:hypothetical protein